MEPSDGESGGYVVVGFDAGWRMKNLLRMAADEASRRKTSLAIVTVATPVLDPNLSVSGQRAAERRAEATDRQHLAEAAESVHLVSGQLPVTTHYLTEEQAHTGEHPLSATQLLVVATAGQHGRRAFGLESVSRILLKATRCPVLVVPEEDPIASGVKQRPAVVAGIGERVSDSAVIQAAWAESVRHGCGLEMVHAYRDLITETPGQGVRRAADVVARAVGVAGAALGDGASVLLSNDDPAGALTRQAGDAVMLVIGSRPGSLSGLVLGSVGREILDSLSCPLLVITDPAHDSGARPGITIRAATTAVQSPNGTPAATPL